MRDIISIGIVLSCALLVAVERSESQGMLPSSPAQIGVTVKSQIQCGDNPVSLEPYDLKVTLLQVVRGNQAWEQIRKASDSNKPAKAAFEYVLARIRFELEAKVSPGNKSFELGSPLQLIAMSAGGGEYEGVSVIPPKPVLRGALRSGQSAEGWVAFSVDRNDRKPMMAFDPASGAATLRGRILWFQLY